VVLYVKGIDHSHNQTSVNLKHLGLQSITELKSSSIQYAIPVFAYSPLLLFTSKIHILLEDVRSCRSVAHICYINSIKRLSSSKFTQNLTLSKIKGNLFSSFENKCKVHATLRLLGKV
jgi:hypothetical protein